MARPAAWRAAGRDSARPPGPWRPRPPAPRPPASPTPRRAWPDGGSGRAQASQDRGHPTVAVVLAAVDQVVVDQDHDRAERDAGQREVVGDLEGHAADAGDDAGGQADDVGGPA